MRSPLRYRLKRLKRSVLAKMAVVSPRFLPLLATPAPLVKMEYRGSEQSKTLIIFLPGIDDLAEDFERRGFIDDMRRHGIAADAVAIDAHYGYYAARVIHERMTDDVLASARAAGYEKIWLAGVSLGGFGAASYASRNVSQVTGLILLAPYLGGAALIREIAGAGGMKNWEPGNVSQDDYQRALWKWFKHHFTNDTPALRIYLGCGTRDMFARAHALLAEVLPEEQVFVIPGGHNWRVWKMIWQKLLAGRSTLY
jgi:pimeloyl-ACP methyl ester carboxylesterase